MSYAKRIFFKLVRGMALGLFACLPADAMVADPRATDTDPSGSQVELAVPEVKESVLAKEDPHPGRLAPQDPSQSPALRHYLASLRTRGYRYH